VIAPRLAAAAICLALVVTARAADFTQEESDAAFRIFLNVKQELVEHCIYKPGELAVLDGAMTALKRELDPEFAPLFPEKLEGNFGKAWVQSQNALRQIAARPELAGRTLKSLVEQALSAYCRTLDRYSEYDDLASYELEMKLKEPPLVGVGMTLDRTAEGFDLYPFPSGPADLAGCFPGDRLIEVDGKPVRGLSKVEVGAMFSGREGTAVKIKVRHQPEGRDEVLTMKREKVVTSFIRVEQQPGGPVVRLRWLTAATVKDLRTFLRTVKADTPLTLDFRGCHGGELAAAVSVAELFLPAGETICRVETRAGTEVFRSANPKPFRAKPLTILQNRGTMSGAELVTVALVTSPEVRAQSRGERSYGKGVTLSVVRVEGGGGRLGFADGRIYGPHGEFWDGEGLAPTAEDPRAR
jgi:carboxyl-terminal processing protease